MVGGEGRQLRCGQAGQLSACHGLQLVLVVSEQAVAEFGRVKRADLLVAQLHKVGRLDGADLGAREIFDLRGRQFLDLRSRERGDVGGRQAGDRESADLSG